MTEDHGKCPNCGLDFNGGLIWQHFFNHFQTVGDYLDRSGKFTNSPVILDAEEAAKRADTVAESYGATRTKGRWGLRIAIYDRDKDRTVAYMCPECKHEYPRV